MTTQLRASFRSLPAAVQYFRQKVNLPTLTWRDLWQGQHTRAFVIAGATRDALLKDMRFAVDQAIAGGESLESFRKRFDDIVGRYGWTYNGGRAWRTRVIYETNLRTAYMAGKYQQLTDPDVLSRHPYWEYRHHSVIDPREQHVAWDHKVLRWDDSWWKVHYPPNGWGCKCDVAPVSAARLAAMGKTEPDEAPPTVDDDVPPEWRYNVGETAWGKPVAASILEAERGGRMAALGERTAAEWNRPDQVPADAPATEVAPATREPEALRQLFQASIGGESSLITDPFGDVVNVTDALIDHWLEDPKRIQGREQYLPLLPSVISDPYEIWIGFARNELTGKVSLRRRYVKVVNVGKQRVLGVIAEADEGQWISFNYFSGGMTALNNLRQGFLVWARDGEGGP